MSVIIDNEYFEKYGCRWHRESIDNLTFMLPVHRQTSSTDERWYHILHYLMQVDHQGKPPGNKFHVSRWLVVPPVNQLYDVLDVGFGDGHWMRDMHRAMSALQLQEQEKGKSSEWNLWGLDLVTNRAVAMEESATTGKTRPIDVEQLKWNLNQPLTNSRDLFGRADQDGRYWAKNPMDLINIRLISTGIKRSRWPHLMDELWSLLKPGGWIQIVEIGWGDIKSENGRMDEALGLKEWLRIFREGSRLTGRSRRVFKFIDETLGDAFEEKHHEKLPIDFSLWRNKEDPQHQDFIRGVHSAMPSAFYSYGMWLACEHLGKTPEEFHRIVAAACQDLQREDLHLTMPCHIWSARKIDGGIVAMKPGDNSLPSAPSRTPAHVSAYLESLPDPGEFGPAEMEVIDLTMDDHWSPI